ncbi:MAG: DUF4363 family protein [Oscillospiraceae bacterium]
MILGIAVLSLLLVLCLGATWTLDRTADQVASLLESAWISEATEEAAAQVAAAQKIWEQNRGLCASLVDHEWLENVEEGFSDLQAWSCGRGRNPSSSEPAVPWPSRSAPWQSLKSPIITTSSNPHPSKSRSEFGTRAASEFAPAFCNSLTLEPSQPWL